jgi:hypothetical protein
MAGEVTVGQSVKFKITTACGERIVRVQNAVHSGRVRLFVDEAPFWQREDSYSLWDETFVHDFELDGVTCRLVISGSHPRLFINEREVLREDGGPSRFR